VRGVSQLSLFSADARPSTLSDLGGLLCGPGQIVRFGAGDQARLSIVLSDAARAPAVRAACAEAGVAAQAVVTGSGATALRTAFRCDLAELATAWTRGAVKMVPPEWQLDGPTLRLWALTAGAPDGRGGYLLGLDPHATQTHQALVAATTRIGLPPARVRGALRISGTRRVGRLTELVGPPPVLMPAGAWPRYRGRSAC
jgi:hypothetical protein